MSHRRHRRRRAGTRGPVSPDGVRAERVRQRLVLQRPPRGSLLLVVRPQHARPQARHARDLRRRRGRHPVAPARLSGGARADQPPGALDGHGSAGGRDRPGPPRGDDVLDVRRRQSRRGFRAGYPPAGAVLAPPSHSIRGAHRGLLGAGGTRALSQQGDVHRAAGARGGGARAGVAVVPAPPRGAGWLRAGRRPGAPGRGAAPRPRLGDRGTEGGAKLAGIPGRLPRQSPDRSGPSNRAAPRVGCGPCDRNGAPRSLHPPQERRFPARPGDARPRRRLQRPPPGGARGDGAGRHRLVRDLRIPDDRRVVRGTGRLAVCACGGGLGRNAGVRRRRGLDRDHAGSLPPRGDVVGARRGIRFVAQPQRRRVLLALRRGLHARAAVRSGAAGSDARATRGRALPLARGRDPDPRLHRRHRPRAELEARRQGEGANPRPSSTRPNAAPTPSTTVPTAAGT